MSTFDKLQLALCAIFCVSCITNRGPATFRGWHHFYIGFALAGPGLLFGWPWWVVGLGMLIEADDAWQHLIHATVTVEYRSPLHKAYGWLYRRVGFLRAVNRWLDARFGA